MSAFLPLSTRLPRQRAIASAAALALAVSLSGCAGWRGIGSDKTTTDVNQLDAHLSIPAQGGKWPDASWADQFGDAQLGQLIAEGLTDSPTIAETKARLEKAAAYVQSERAAEMPVISGKYSWTRELYSGNGLFPPPYGGTWYSENNALINATWDLDLWGKNRQATAASISQQKVAEADAQEVRLTLATSIAQTYTELAREYALLDVAQRETESRREVGRITVGRVAAGLDTQVERRTSDGNIASSQASITQLEGQITTTRYQLGALLGKGPDRGLSIAKPTMNPTVDVPMPDNVPANLLSRRPDLVAARWTIDANQHDIKSAKAEFLPDVNLAGFAGFDGFGWAKFLQFGSRQFQVGPAINIPIFAGGALRANLKGKYADFDLAVAEYNQTLVNALNDVATQIASIHSTEKQLVDAEAAYDAQRHAYELAVIRYKAGLSPQLQVLNADENLLAQEQGVVALKMNRRSQQIALIKALGGGFDAQEEGLNPPLAGAVKGSDDAAGIPGTEGAAGASAPGAASAAAAATPPSQASNN
ncbi:Efflux transporter outer membrane subunit [Pararobbsia alpina]|uniref:efflux transporter outer membrane subunit n=1 Tax=Pararobbsia alpina TaxID=621374 RepID=UPI0039A570D8